MTDKEKIKQEIERRIKNLEFSLENNCVEKHSKLDILGNITTLESLLQFIDSLPKESGCEVNFTTKSEDLEEEIKNWIKTKHFVFTEIDEVIETAKHFAEWQKKKDQETIELAEDHAMLAGMNRMKEEMMKDAVEGTVKYEIGSAEIPQCDKRYQVLSDPAPITNAKLGDKVKILILKTE